ncbi:MAG: hypothetical protein VCC00_10980 [Deltaproteobacteria bacterium]
MMHGRRIPGIIVLLRDRASRDADLDPRRLTAAELAHIQGLAGVPLQLRHAEADGARTFWFEVPPQIARGGLSRNLQVDR